MRAPDGIVVVGCSAGGLRALRGILPQLRADLELPVVVVCHTGSGDVGMLCAVLSRDSALPVEEARERHYPEAGVVHLAPTGYHLLIERDKRFGLSVDERVCFVRPAADVLFDSASRVFGASTVGVILTGANADGAEGLRAVRRRRGIGVVQLPSEAEAAAMPEAALEAAGADYCVPLAQIAPILNGLALKR